MADNPIHLLASPIGVNYTTQWHDPKYFGAISVDYDTFYGIYSEAVNVVDVKDHPHLTLNDWVYAARVSSLDT